MSRNTVRYKVEIPAVIVVRLDKNLSVISHQIDTNVYTEPTVVDYASTAGAYTLDDPEAEDPWGNALTYAHGLRVFNYKQLMDLGIGEICEMPGSEDIS
jgi:hypothetical protein